MNAMPCLRVREGGECMHKCLANHEPHLPHAWWYASSGGGHQLHSYDPVSGSMERNVTQHQCPGIEGTLNTDGMDPLTAEMERQAFDEEWVKIRRLSSPAFGPPKIPPGKYNAQISSKPGEPLEFTVDLPDNHTPDDMFEAMNEAARKAGLL